MKALVISKQGPIVHENVTLADWPDPPAPPAGHARVRTLCSALNHLDLWVGKGVPGLKLTYPRVGGSDACGVIDALGPDTDSSWLGKQVILNAASAKPAAPRPDDPPTPLAADYELLGEHHHGVHAQFFNAPVTNLQHLPAIDPPHAAAFGLTFLTAYSMLVTKAQVRPGHFVLITGIGGGVATATLNLCVAFGARPIVTSRQQWKLDKARDLGAIAGILDDGSDFSRKVREATAGRGADIAIDSSGKATHLWCIKSLARGGTYATPGCTSGPDATTDLARIFWNQLRILGSTMGSNDEFASLTAMLRAGKLAPVVDRVFPAANGADAYAHLASSQQMGKVVIDWR